MCFAARFVIGRDEIDSAGMKGMTTTDTAHGQPRTAHNSMLPDRFDGIG